MMVIETPDTIVVDAKADRRKGDYRVYTEYTQRLGILCADSYQYQECCKAVAKALRV